MDQNSQADSLRILESQLRECYGRVTYTHKTQEKCADIIKAKNDQMKLWQILLSAAISTSFFVKIFGSLKFYEVDVAFLVGAVLSMILLALNTYLKDYDLGSLMQKHSNCATDLWAIRESYLSLLTDIKANLLATTEIITRRDELQERLTGIYLGSPRTISKAYTEAQKALKVNEELTFSDAEIDVFLPNDLRRSEL